jgi:glycosyltransferase involved in cell wall biosynthesis
MYNERDNIAVTLERALAVLPTLGFADFEILVVDDGSRDDSAAVVHRESLREPRIRLVSHPRNLGYGAALRTGFTAARGDVVFYTDSDLPVDLAEIGRALPLLEDAELVIGYRRRRYDTPRRAVYSKVYNLLMRVLFGVRVRDVNFSFKLVRRQALDAITLTASTVFIDGQLLAAAVRGGFRIAELPIDYTPRRVGKSSFDSVHAAWVTLVEMLRYRLAPHSLPVPELPVIHPRPEALGEPRLHPADAAAANGASAVDDELLPGRAPPAVRGGEMRAPKAMT